MCSTGVMDSVVEAMSKAFDEFVTAAAGVIEANAASDGERTAGTDAALQEFKDRYELFRAACDGADELVCTARGLVQAEHVDSLADLVLRAARTKDATEKDPAIADSEKKNDHKTSSSSSSSSSSNQDDASKASSANPVADDVPNPDNATEEDPMVADSEENKNKASPLTSPSNEDDAAMTIEASVAAASTDSPSETTVGTSTDAKE